MAEKKIESIFEEKLVAYIMKVSVRFTIFTTGGAQNNPERQRQDLFS